MEIKRFGERKQSPSSRWDPMNRVHDLGRLADLAFCAAKPGAVCSFG